MPTQTYTPTATFHPTGQYQENGDTSDANVLQDTGQKAMDNVANLTGSNTNEGARKLGTVADIAALKALTDQRDEDVITVEGVAMFQFDSGSSATADDYSVVQPTVGAGRYIRLHNVPKVGPKRWLQSALSVPIDVPGGTMTRDYANGWCRSSGGGTHLYHFAFEGDFNPGDVIDTIYVAGDPDAVGAGVNIVANFYQITANAGGVPPTSTALGTVTIVNDIRAK